MHYVDFVDGAGIFNNPYTTDIVCDSFEVERLDNGNIEFRATVKLGGKSFTHKFSILPQRLIVRPAKLN